MARSVRTISYTVSNVTDLLDLVGMMRYDGMRFPDTGTGLKKNNDWRSVIAALARHSCGVIEKDDPDVHSIELWKDQTIEWIPTAGRWRSFGMLVDTTDSWDRAREIN